MIQEKLNLAMFQFNFNRTPTPSNEECEVNEAIEEAESKVNENPSGVTGMTVTNNDIFTVLEVLKIVQNYMNFMDSQN